MKFFLILLVFAVLVQTNVSFAQYFGQIESYEFFIFSEGQHEIRLQSSITKFNDVFYDDLANAVILFVESDDDLVDSVSISMNYSSFRTLIADDKDAEPSDALILLNGEEQEYYTPRITNDRIVWEFKNKPNTTEIELILEPTPVRALCESDDVVLIDGVCQKILQKSHGDDAPFFGIFVYLDNLISWIFGR